MLLSPSKAKQIICDCERTINDSLLLLVCRPPHADYHVTRRTLVCHLEEIADMRFGDPPQPGTADYYLSLLYREPFDLAPTANITYRMERLRRLHYPVWLERDP